MKRTLAIAMMLLCTRAPESHASCGYTAPAPAKFVVDKCSVVDTSKLEPPARPASYEGLLLEGMLTTGKTKPIATKVWVPAAEQLTCARAAPTATVTATMSYACCDGDSNPPCLLETGRILTKISIATPGPKPVKSMTRAELEAEVVRLRAELDAMLAQARARTKQLEQETRALTNKLRN
jgi:hypothetical protein